MSSFDALAGFASDGRRDDDALGLQFFDLEDEVSPLHVPGEDVKLGDEFGVRQLQFAVQHGGEGLVMRASEPTLVSRALLVLAVLGVSVVSWAESWIEIPEVLWADELVEATTVGSKERLAL